MAKKKYDGVIEAVRYEPDGQVAWVRAYVRRSFIFSDRILIDRQALIEDLNAGKRYVTGKRVPYMAATFETGQPVHMVKQNGQELLAVGDAQPDHDDLEGVPLL